ncbi:hypothetical protein DDV96_02555 [Marixanthomonas spongiae]|uniref:Uncharacterized protein n=1 Tax=Marixanthomonas spongiae TaxID=2174845 RepID=A0A2U0I8H5_9FLAO|nr:hypothetical protein DDV96_02555 [Marixanthomonas spongiae]
MKTLSNLFLRGFFYALHSPNLSQRERNCFMFLIKSELLFLIATTLKGGRAFFFLNLEIPPLTPPEGRGIGFAFIF